VFRGVSAYLNPSIVFQSLSLYLDPAYTLSFRGLVDALKGITLSYRSAFLSVVLQLCI
jgi:hypothetical protein